MSKNKNTLIDLNNSRDYGIDLLRILAMFMVVIHHVVEYGGILHAESISNINYWSAYFIDIAVYCAVDTYALISGFVGYKVNRKYASLAELWLRVTFYSVSFTIVNKLMFDPLIGKKKILLSFFPVTRKNLWYFTMYFGVILLSPVLNAAINAMSRKTARRAVIGSIFLFSVLPFLWSNDVFESKDGYSVIWLMVLYLAGAYIGKYHALEIIKKPTAIIGYFICVLLTWCSKFILQNRFPVMGGYKINYDWLVSYTSVTVVAASVFLLLLFRELRLPAAVKKIVAIAAPLSFGVYVIHGTAPFSTHIIQGKFARFASCPPVVMTLVIIGSAALIYIVCSMIDFIRKLLFDTLKIKERLKKAEQKLLPDD